VRKKALFTVQIIKLFSLPAVLCGSLAKLLERCRRNILKQLVAKNRIPATVVPDIDNEIADALLMDDGKNRIQECLE
jgi:hypothetical protein